MPTYTCILILKFVEHRWVTLKLIAGDKFRNPFDFIMDEEKQAFAAAPIPTYSTNEVKPDVMIFKPYEISTTKTATPGQTIDLLKPPPVQATQL